MSGSATVQVLTCDLGGHVSIELVDAYNELFCRELGWQLAPCSANANAALLDKLIRRAGFGPICRAVSRRQPTFVILMSPHRIPHFAAALAFAKGPKAALAFDVWPNDFEFVAQIARGYGLSHLFLTSKEASEHLQLRLPGVSVDWFPEALVSDCFKPKPLQDRTIDVMQMGRKYMAVHEPIAALGGVNYVYEKVTGQIIYPQKQDLYDAMCNSKISICFTRSITHPEIAGDLATVTQRYLESMAAGCIVLGSVPAELLEMFPYPPMIEADVPNIADQVQSILSNVGEYEDLVTRNRQYVLDNHMLSNRLEKLRTFGDQAKK